MTPFPLYILNRHCGIGTAGLPIVHAGCISGQRSESVIRCGRTCTGGSAAPLRGAAHPAVIGLRRQPKRLTSPSFAVSPLDLFLGKPAAFSKRPRNNSPENEAGRGHSVPAQLRYGRGQSQSPNTIHLCLGVSHSFRLCRVAVVSFLHRRRLDIVASRLSN